MPGFVKNLTLPRGHIVGDYRLLEVLGKGGFGVTYLGAHVNSDGLAAIKEYFPNEFANRDGVKVKPRLGGEGVDFAWGLRRFRDEAETLSRLQHPNLVQVKSYFEDNGTAYIVMRYEDGKPFDELLDRHGKLTETLLRRLLVPLAEGLREVHAAKYLHRDIKPSNIYVRRKDESPVLIDFGSARRALERRSQSLSAIVTHGYSPPEQYETRGEQGPWTDIYALAALCYRAIVGSVPTQSVRRQGNLLRGQADPLPSLAAIQPPGCSASLLAAVDWGLRVDAAERPQSIDEWLTAIQGETAGPDAHSADRTRPVRSPMDPIAVSEPLRIGRGQDMDVVINSRSVSRLHAELTVVPATGRSDACGYQIADCDSTNGTYTLRSGRWMRIHRQVLDPDAPLRLGDYETTPAGLEQLAAAYSEESFVLDDRSVPWDDQVSIEHAGEDLPVGVPVRRRASTGEILGE